MIQRTGSPLPSNTEEACLALPHCAGRAVHAIRSNTTGRATRIRLVAELSSAARRADSIDAEVPRLADLGHEAVAVISLWTGRAPSVVGVSARPHLVLIGLAAGRKTCSAGGVGGYLPPIIIIMLYWCPSDKIIVDSLALSAAGSTFTAARHLCILS